MTTDDRPTILCRECGERCAIVSLVPADTHDAALLCGRCAIARGRAHARASIGTTLTEIGKHAPYVPNLERPGEYLCMRCGCRVTADGIETAEAGS